MIYVIADITVSPGRRDEFVRLFKKLVPSVQAEDGCLEYGPTIDLETSVGAQAAIDPNVVTVIEKWESVTALERHLMAPHMLTFREEAKELMQGLRLRIVEPA